MVQWRSPQGGWRKIAKRQLSNRRQNPRIGEPMCRAALSRQGFIIRPTSVEITKSSRGLWRRNRTKRCSHSVRTWTGAVSNSGHHCPMPSAAWHRRRPRQSRQTCCRAAPRQSQAWPRVRSSGVISAATLAFCSWLLSSGQQMRKTGAGGLLWLEKGVEIGDALLRGL